MKRFLLFLLPLTSFAAALAADLGQHGSVFEIEETDLLTVIEHKAQQHSNRFVEFLNDARERITKPNALSGIEQVSKSSVRKFDPTVFLDDDIIVDGKVLYAQGMPINPLNFTEFPKLVFIDGTVERQTEFARNINAITILTNGTPGLHHDHYFYFDQGGIYTNRFNIKRVPAIVYQERNEKVLTIQEVLLEKT